VSVFFTRKKACFAAGCKRMVPSRRLMCKEHWLLVPHSMRVEIYAGLDLWQSGRSPKTYLEAIQRARAFVAEAEAKLARK
jgi:hypothetical protein